MTDKRRGGALVGMCCRVCVWGRGEREGGGGRGILGNRCRERKENKEKRRELRRKSEVVLHGEW